MPYQFTSSLWVLHKSPELHLPDARAGETLTDLSTIVRSTQSTPINVENDVQLIILINPRDSADTLHLYAYDSN